MYPQTCYHVVWNRNSLLSSEEQTSQQLHNKDFNVFKFLPLIKTGVKLDSWQLIYCSWQKRDNLSLVNRTVCQFANCSRVNLHWSQCKDSWKSRNQPLLWSFTVEEESYPSGRKEMQLDTVFAWLDHGNQVTAKVSSLISSEEWIPHCKIPLIPIPAVSSLCNIKAWHSQRRLTLPHHLPVSPPPASTPHCQTNRNRTFSESSPSTAFLWQLE